MVKEVNRQMMKRAVLLLLTMAAAFTAARGAALVRVQQETSSARQASLFRPSPVLTRQDRLRDSNHEIFVMNRDGSNKMRLTKNPADDVDHDWGVATP